MKATYSPYQLTFRSPVLTSRGQMTHKNGYYINIEQDGIIGTGECSFIEGLSIDDLPSYENVLKEVCQNIAQIGEVFYQNNSLPLALVADYPSLAFGIEMALLDLKNGGKQQIICPSRFHDGTQSIAINGLIWMGDEAKMQAEIDEKIEAGYNCIKIKVAAIDFKEECRLLDIIRKKFNPEQIEIRLDANGGFTEKDVREKLKTLAQFIIHSIEQPIKPQQYLLMRSLCEVAIIPVALDEELIGTYDPSFKLKLLQTIMPTYIILKPSLLGGLTACDDWIKIAEQLNIKWWATSALESNVGLNAIAQWVATKNPILAQGLGTGELYTHNTISRLYIEKGRMRSRVFERINT